MRTTARSAAALAATALAVGLLVTTPAQAVDEPAPSQTGTLKVIETSSLEPAEEMTEALEEFLRGHDIQGDITVQQAADGTAMYLDGDGGWAIVPATGKGFES